MLRRMKCLFKDYDKTPIGFGVVVFCIAKSDSRSSSMLTAQYIKHSISSPKLILSAHICMLQAETLAAVYVIKLQCSGQHAEMQLPHGPDAVALTVKAS